MRRAKARVQISTVPKRTDPPNRGAVRPPLPAPPKGSVDLFLNCPHCNGLVSVFAHDIKCTIFRHGIWKANGRPIDPHTPKAECDRLLRDGLIYGCSKPFKFNGTTVEICGYL